MSISLLYSRLYNGEVLRLECGAKTYHTIRTGLIKKYNSGAAMLSGVGDDSMLNSYVQATYCADTGIAEFQIKPLAEKRRKTLSYKLL